ncbi:hypothetical protein CWD77_08055 [Rhodohalobacter barkolensis]|uniref:Uncharacterized protein n=1 Tax=Rhodohalobacter barkolensis TaxID=2053187 RepID=A0A2N0VH66_9BACT|nr:hypothetical protein CWD77_08055 [Rhodohalobacter barkolensis]
MNSPNPTICTYEISYHKSDAVSVVGFFLARQFQFSLPVSKFLKPQNIIFESSKKTSNSIQI